MTPSLGNFIASLVAGAFIAITIGGVLVFISQTDRITRSQYFKSYKIYCFELASKGPQIEFLATLSNRKD